MNSRRLTYWLSALVGSAIITGCGSSNSGSPSGERPFDPSSTGGGGSGGGGGSTGPSTGPTTDVRIAHLSPGAPAVDICIAAHGSSAFAGPVLTGAGLAGGLAYGSVTRYLPIPAGTYDVRIVAPGATSCTNPLGGLPDITNLPELTEGAYTTIAAEGIIGAASAEPFHLAAYSDEMTPNLGSVELRFIHASPGTPAVDVVLGAGALFTNVFTDASYGGIATSGVDSNGYVQTPPLSGVTLSARPHGTLEDVLSIASASIPAGAVATAFAVGQIGSATTPLRVLLCIDNAPAQGGLTACSIVGGPPALGFARIAHLSPDAPNVDVCLRTSGAAAFTGSPLLASLAGKGITYPQVTTYVPLPTGIYDVRITASGDCSAGAVPDTMGVKVPLGVHATVAALGELSPAGDDPAFHLGLFVDDVTTTATMAELRFIHASPGAPAVNIGLMNEDVINWIFRDVSFGQVGTSPLGDANGYVATSPFTDGTVSAMVSSTGVMALSVPGLALAGGSLVTTFAIGGKTGDSANPLQVLVCADSAPPVGFFTACMVAGGK
jgi:hypothetical protein